MSALEASDFAGLLDLLGGREPRWTYDALRRCHENGLVSPNGMTLTGPGISKTTRMSELLNDLQQGVKLDTPRANLAHELSAEEWLRARFGETYITWNARVLLAGDRPEQLTCQRVQPDDPQLRSFRLSLLPTLKSDNLVRIQPYAWQKNVLGGLEVICFALKVPRKEAQIVRIQTRYYDFIVDRWPDVTWWHLPTKQDSPVIAKAVDPRPLKNRIVALVMPVITSGWAVPRIK